MKINSRGMRKQILKLYGEDMQVANDDKLLISRIWAMEGWTCDRSIYQNLLHVSSPETIRRTRARLVEEGLIKPSKEVTEARYKEYKETMKNL